MLRSCPPGRFQDILQCFLEQFPVLFAKEGIVVHQELLSSTLKPRELSAQPPAASPQTLPDGASPHVGHVPVFVSNMEQICHLVRFLRRSETHRVSCSRLSGEGQAEPKGCKVLLIPLAPPIALETGAHTQTLSQTHTHKHTNKRYTQTQHIHYLHTYTYKSTNIAHTYNTHEYTFTHRHMNIHTQHTNTNIRHRDHSQIYSQQLIHRNTTHTIHACTHKHTNTRINVHMIQANITHIYSSIHK